MERIAVAIEICDPQGSATGAAGAPARVSDGLATKAVTRRVLRAFAGAAMAVTVLLAGCSSTPAQRAVVYDFGPGALAAPSAATPAANGKVRVPVLLADVDAVGALDGNALLYRLAYAQAQQVHPYAAARWGVPAAQLVRQRLRDQLGQQRTVLSPGDVPPAGVGVLRVELEEFSQVFDSPQSSAALVRVRVTLNRPVLPAAMTPVVAGAPGSSASSGTAAQVPAPTVAAANALERALAQTVFVIRVPASSPDAAGGARALAQASDQLARQLDGWLQQVLGETTP